MRRALKVGGATAVGLTLVLVAVAPAGAQDFSTGQSPNKVVNVVIGTGSDTTYNVMSDLADFYNRTPGCETETNADKQGGYRCADFNLSNNTTNGTTPGPAGTKPWKISEIDAGYFGQGVIDAFGIRRANADHDYIVNLYPVGSSSGVTALSGSNVDLPLGNSFLNTPDPTDNPNRAVDFARSSRRPTASDVNGLLFHAFAKDAVAPVTWGSGPLNGDGTGTYGATDPAKDITNLSRTTLQNIYVTCSVTTWGQAESPVDPANTAPIIVWAAQSGSGTQATYRSLLLNNGNDQNCIGSDQKNSAIADGERVIFENDATPILNSTNNDCEVRDPITGNGIDNSNPAGLGNSCEDWSIFIFSLGRLQQVGFQETIRGTAGAVGGLNVDGVAPSETNIVNGSFPGSRDVFNVIRHNTGQRDARSYIRDFVGIRGFLCKPASQHDLLPDPDNPGTFTNGRTIVERIIRDNGFIPIPLGASGTPETPSSVQSHCRIINTNDVN